MHSINNANYNYNYATIFHCYIFSLDPPSYLIAVITLMAAVKCVVWA